MSIPSGGQIERLLWAAAEARRLRAEPEKVAAHPVPRRVVLADPGEQFTTEWQSPFPGERA